MKDRKSSGRISEGRKIFKRTRGEGEPEPLADIVEQQQDSEQPAPKPAQPASRHEEIAAALKALDLPEYSVSEVTAVDTFEVDGQTVVQLKNGDFVRVAMITNGQGGDAQQDA